MIKNKCKVATIHNSIGSLISYQEAVINKLRYNVPPELLVLMSDILTVLKMAEKTSCQVYVSDEKEN